MTLAALPKFVSGGIIRFADEKAVARQTGIERLKYQDAVHQRQWLAACPAATSRKLCSPNGALPGSACSSSIIPTRGIDVGAKEDVYELVRDMTAEGLAVILLGDTLEEVIGLSNRILVMRDGEVTARFEAPRATSRPRSIS